VYNWVLPPPAGVLLGCGHQGSPGSVIREFDPGAQSRGAAPGHDQAVLGPAFHSPDLAQRPKPTRTSQLLSQVQVATSPLGGELFGEAHADYIVFRPPVLRT
jgi:hypothetical protein